MNDSQRYAERSQTLMRLAHQLGGEEGEAYLQLASAYVDLARDAAAFEAAAGRSLTPDLDDRTAVR